MARLVGAYVRGFQGAELGPDSVACVTKHFPGGGPQRDGEDPHFPYGKDQMYPGGMFEHHLRVFEAGFAAGTAQVMPYYGRPVGTPFEAVGPTCEADECEAERCGGSDLQMVAAQRRHEQEQECKRDGEGCRDRKPHHLPIGRPPEHVERLPRGNGFPWKGASYAPGDDDDLRGGRGR